MTDPAPALPAPAHPITPPDQALDAAAGLPVQVLSVRVEAGHAVSRRYAGSVVARRSSTLAFDRPGRLVAVLADLGDQVRAGQEVARLDTRALAAEARALAAQARMAQADCADLDARLALARRTEARLAALAGRAAASRQDHDEARFEAQALAARLEGARAALDRLAAEREALAVAMDLSRLVAPYDAQIVARPLDEGTAVQPGQAVLTLRETGALEGHVGVPVETARRLTPGQDLVVETGSGARLAAVVRRRVDQVSDQTRTVLVILDLVEPAQDGADPAQAGGDARSAESGFDWQDPPPPTLPVGRPDGAGAVPVASHPASAPRPIPTSAGASSPLPSPTPTPIPTPVGPPRVLPGEIIHLVIPIWVDEPGLWVPRSALTEGRRGVWTLFVVEPAEPGGAPPRVVRREVTVLFAEADRAFVRGDLADGDRVVAVGAWRLAPGQPVRPVPVAPSAPSVPSHPGEDRP